MDKPRAKKPSKTQSSKAESTNSPAADKEALNPTQKSRNLENRVASYLHIRNSLAKPGYNRWMVPPAALAIHLSIGMAYGFSVFWLPLQNSLGVGAATCPNFLVALFSSVCQWRLDDLLWIYALFFLFLGGAAATRGTWLERVGPRHAGVEAAFCWGGGLVLAGIGAGMHQLWLMCLGAGVIGGIGLGVGYISPVSLLIKWFPDRRGVAVGMAIMGFGGGAMIGSPLASLLMTNWLGTPAQPAIWQTLIVLGLIYFVFMLVASLNYRLPPSQWQPKGWVKPDFTKSLMTARSVHVNHAHRTVQFWLLWFMLFFNVSAGISILAIASNMFQKLFGGKLIGLPDLGYGALSVDQQAVVAGIGAGFVGALSIGNILGRIFWAGLSDRIGRKQVYYIFFGIGLLLYIFTPLFASMGIQFMFVAGLFVIISMYGGGFASLPAYIADLFGTTFVGAIHGRILTAWSAAGVVGTFIIPYVVNNRIDAGLDLGLAYSVTFYILAGFLLIGAGLNFLIHTLDDKHFMSPQAVQDHYIKVRGMEFKGDHTMGIGLGSLAEPKVWLAWSLVVLPMLWGAWFTVEKMVSSLK